MYLFRCLLLVLLPMLARAQAVAPSQLRFRHLTVNEGLAHSDAMAVAQDQTGFIWVGTNRGLDRYDGYDLRHYTLPVTAQGLPGNRIKVVHATAGGQLWVGTERAGLHYYDLATDHLLPLSLAGEAPPTQRALLTQLAVASVVALASDAQGGLWVATEHDGLFYLAAMNASRPRSLIRIPVPLTAAGQPVQLTSLAADAEGNLWVGSLDQGLCVVRRAQAHPQAVATTLTQPVRLLLLDRRGDLWVGTERQVLWVSAANRRAVRELTAHPQPYQYPQLQSMLLDSFGRLWVGTIYGLYVWEAGPVTGTAPPLRPAPTLLLPREGSTDALNSERVHQLFEDRTQVLWLCVSAGGLDRVDLRQKPFSWLHREPGGQATLPNNYVNAVYQEEATNTLWLGTRNGIAAYDLTHHTYRTYLTNGTAGTALGTDVATICRTHDGSLWFGTRGRGLVHLTRPHGRAVLTTLPGEPSLAGSAIEHLAEDRAGTLWVATFAHGLYRFSLDGQLLGHYQRGQHGLPTSHFSFLLYDPGRDALWASTTDAGLLRLQVGGPDTLRVQRQYRHQPGATSGLQANYVWPLLLDPQGTLWIGTIGGGLHHLDPDAPGCDAVRSDRRYLPETDVESLLADDLGQLWLGGTGLYRYTPAAHQYTRYDVGDGLQSNSFKIGSAARGADGTLYFGGINGVSYFQPAAIQPNPYPPVVQLTGLRLNNQPVAASQEVNGRVVLTRPLTAPQTITIQPSEKDFAVEFVGLNYANPPKTRYAYRLDGYNADWVSPLPGQRTASFANLPPGRYTLQLRASNGEGAWSALAVPLTIEVLAPWYKTGWAYALYGLAVLLAVALYRRVEMNQQQLRNKLELKQFQSEKENELTNLKLGFFTNISHELRTPLTLILGPMEEILTSAGPLPDLRDKVQLMERQARKLLELVNQLLDFRKVESGHVPLRARRADLLPWLREQYAAFELKARERGVTYVLDAPPGPLPLYFDDSKLEITLTNLLANAFKYVRDRGRVELTAVVVGQPGGEAEYQQGQLTGNYVKIMVSDTGVGIAPHELDRIFDPYYQAAHTNTLRMQGTGIGLALARQFAERHGGRLLVASTQGVGTTFELRLPLGCQHLQPGDLLPEPAAEAALAPTPASELAAAELPAAEPGGPPLLLLVEDHDEVRDYLRQLFEGEYAVMTAEDGLAGWDRALTHLPDLVVSDVMMPRSDGLELCQRLKAHPKTAHIPVLLLTARTAETHQLEGLGLGADDYVSKPFAPAVLQARVEALLRGRRRLHEFYQRNILLQPTEVAVPDADREFLEKAMQVVEQHLGSAELNVQVLVREMAMSQSAFYRRIKGLTGQTAVEFIRDVRLKRAAQLLTSSQLLVSEVAYEVGIEDTRYFSKSFQKLFGQTPSDYARQHRGARTEASS